MSNQQQRTRFCISAIGYGAMMDVDNLMMTPNQAARLDPDEFLRFAEMVAKVAERLRTERAQTRMELETG